MRRTSSKLVKILWEILYEKFYKQVKVCTYKQVFPNFIFIGTIFCWFTKSAFYHLFFFDTTTLLVYHFGKPKSSYNHTWSRSILLIFNSSSKCIYKQKKIFSFQQVWATKDKMHMWQVTWQWYRFMLSQWYWFMMLVHKNGMLSYSCFIKVISFCWHFTEEWTFLNLLFRLAFCAKWQNCISFIGEFNCFHRFFCYYTY